MKKFFAVTTLMSLLIFACGGETETEVADDGKVTSTLGVIMNEWDVKPSPNYKMGKHIPPGDIDVTLTNAGQLEHNMYVLNQDSFNNSLKKGKDGEGLKPKKKELLGYKLSRKSESNADISAAKMLINAGYEYQTPIKAHDFFAKLGGYGYITEKESTHPGYEDRRKKLKIFLEKLKQYPI